MNCYQCAVSGHEAAALGICLNCGAGLCLDHLQEAQTYRNGGTVFGCPHNPAAAAIRPKP
jgi:hypothetical protein